MVVVRLATAQDVGPASRVLAEAFKSDPMHRWIFPGERWWSWGSRRSFAIAIRQELQRASVWVDSELRGAAIWHAPNIRRGVVEQAAFALRMLPLLAWRAPSIGSAFGKLEALHPQQPHWYLYAIGTDPKHQGAGIGSALMKAALAQCDADRLPAYLEASKAENVPYYERFGFRVTRDFVLPDGPTVWCMTRPAS